MIMITQLVKLNLTLTFLGYAMYMRVLLELHLQLMKMETYKVTLVQILQTSSYLMMVKGITYMTHQHLLESLESESQLVRW